jgi:hypothetical protein
MLVGKSEEHAASIFRVEIFWVEELAWGPVARNMVTPTHGKGLGYLSLVQANGNSRKNSPFQGHTMFIITGGK